MAGKKNPFIESDKKALEAQQRRKLDMEKTFEKIKAQAEPEPEKEDGEKKYFRTTVSLTKEQAKKLRFMAAENMVSASKMVQMLIDDYELQK